MLTLSNCLAVLGACFGFIALVINIKTYRTKRANLKIIIPKINGKSISYFFSKDILFEKDLFAEPYRAIMQVDLNNDSDSLITIYEYHLIYKNKTIATATQYLSNILNYKFAIDKNNVITFPIKEMNVFPLLTLKQYEYKRGFLVFVFKPSFDTNLDKVNFEIKALTSRGNFKTPWFLCENIKNVDMPPKRQALLNAEITASMHINKFK